MAILSTVILTGCATTPPVRCTEDFAPINATEAVQP
jgi:hypothetical protein